MCRIVGQPPLPAAAIVSRNSTGLVVRRIIGSPGSSWETRQTLSEVEVPYFSNIEAIQRAGNLCINLYIIFVL